MKPMKRTHPMRAKNLLVLLLTVAVGPGCGGGGDPNMQMMPMPDMSQEIRPGSFGAPCAKNADCDSALCLEVGRCSKSCTGAGDCPASSNWSCSALQGVGDLCQCTKKAATETCD